LNIWGRKTYLSLCDTHIPEEWLGFIFGFPWWEAGD